MSFIQLSIPGHGAYSLPPLPCLRLRFSLVPRQEAFLPSFKGSLLRGAFGHALRRTVCVMGPQQPCPTCMLRKQCVHPRLFETLIEPDEPVPRFLRGLPTAPRPYIFEPFDEQRLYRPGESLRFDLILIGRATELHPFAIFAVSQMAESGLGFKRIPFQLDKVLWQKAIEKAQVASKKWQVANGKWQVAKSKEQTEKNKQKTANEKLQLASEQEIEDEWRLLYDGATKRLLETPTPQLLTTSHITNSALSLATCHLRFLTPTRLKFNNTLTIDFSFRMLVFKMIRRVLELAHFHVPGVAIDWEFHPLLVAADAVKIVHRDLRWMDWERRSNRQKTEMLMGGFVGEMVLEGDLSPFVDLLRTCEVVHVGKGCVFGNGKIEANFKQQKENSK
ncbi:MAG: CRISPR system precrRNA processing endoribonuclease RAMP protein Cas6 [candidate division KSB1 bacterium]|nr:CRISPR system precrRNA processing endoribonuclease RAMP protein Cas6 [candidate division KSB1 bacterium]MDZ7365931.1 CRISPR system precrRNA processing endoribonuclease RAMP protein Cas6 [candidate division KSB1 bacterium]MDZ7403835.1 CRISPR system precrRNA processing endoribonuclease RAMP protein Cas6 [candidate division KSB1 bacterium]